MKWIVALFALALPAIAGDRTDFAGGGYSLEFPAGWEKADGPGGKAELTRESPDKDVLLVVHADAIPDGAAADLDATVKSSVEGFAKAVGFKGEPRVSDGMLDGCKAKFVSLMPKTAEEGPLAMFAVFIDTGKHLVRLTATMQTQAKQETRDACLAIVKSFRRETGPGIKDDE
jgi:hypothetical protein